MTVYIADAHAHVQRLVSVVKMATMLEECSIEEHCSVVQRIFIKKCFLFTVESICCVKQFTTGSRNSLKMFGSRRWCPTRSPCWDCNRCNHAASGRLDSNWQEDKDRQCSNCIRVFPWFSIQHNAWLKFWKVCAQWVPRQLKDWEKMNRMCLSLQHL
jgi:hypothetical protein